MTVPLEIREALHAQRGPRHVAEVVARLCQEEDEAAAQAKVEKKRKPKKPAADEDGD